MNKRKSVALFVSMLMLFSSLCTNISYASSPINVVVGTAESSEGSTVIIPISIEGIQQTGINNFDFQLEYDSNVLEVNKEEGVVPGGIIPNPVANFSANMPKDGKIIFLFSDTTEELFPITKDGVLANIHFNIKSGAPEGEYPISFKRIGAFADKAHNAYIINKTEGKVIVKNKVKPTAQATATATPASNESAFKIEIGSTQAKAGESVSIPIKFSNVPSLGINNCDFRVQCNLDVFEIESITPGKILKGSFYSRITKSGRIILLYSDENLGLDQITEDGVFATINLKIKEGVKPGKYDIMVADVGGFSNKNMEAIEPEIINGQVILNDVQPTEVPIQKMKISVGSAEVFSGSEVIIPIKFSDVPKDGLNNFDFSVSYDSKAIEVVSVDSGSIVPKFGANFTKNIKEDIIKILYNDYTQKEYPIDSDGVLANIKLKAKSGVSGVYKLECKKTGAFSSLNNNVRKTVEVSFESGVLTIKPSLIDPTVTPTIKPTVTPTVIPTITPTVNPSNEPSATKETVKVIIETKECFAGKVVTIPVNFQGVPAKGINNLDFILSYDQSVLTIEGIEAGNIIPKPTDFDVVSKGKGEIKFLYNDSTQGSNPIRNDGVFAYIKVVVNKNAEAGSYNFEKKQVGAFSSLNGTSRLSVGTSFKEGGVIVKIDDTKPTDNNESTPTSTLLPSVIPTATPTPDNRERLKVVIGDLDANAGDEIEVPVDFQNVPTTGINNCNFKISYNSEIFKVVGVNSGEIIDEVNSDFALNSSIKGSISFFFADKTQASAQIIRSGNFAEIKFKVNENAPTGVYNISVSSVGAVSDKKIKPIPISFEDGQISVKGIDNPDTKPADKFSVIIGDVKGKAGDVVNVPIYLSGVPEQGIKNVDFKLKYNSSIVDVNEIIPGSIISKPISDFSSRIANTGRLIFLFSDSTQMNYPIKEDGIFANISVKLKADVTSDTNIIELAKLGAFTDTKSQSIEVAVVNE